MGPDSTQVLYSAFYYNVWCAWRSRTHQRGVDEDIVTKSVSWRLESDNVTEDFFSKTGTHNSANPVPNWMQTDHRIALIYENEINTNVYLVNQP